MEESRIVKLEIPNSPQYVSVARKAFQAIAWGIGLPEREAEDLELAVGEACANAVKYGDPGDQTIQIVYRINKNSVEIEVCNRGKAFTPHVSTKPLEDLKVGGLGLFLIDHLMDKMSIDCKSGETRLRMVKQLAQAK